MRVIGRRAAPVARHVAPRAVPGIGGKGKDMRKVLPMLGDQVAHSAQRVQVTVMIQPRENKDIRGDMRDQPGFGQRGRGL